MKDRMTITTLGALRASGYQPRSVKEELRANLIEKLNVKSVVYLADFAKRNQLI